jgi:hypothetical protein
MQSVARLSDLDLTRMRMVGGWLDDGFRTTLYLEGPRVPTFVLTDPMRLIDRSCHLLVFRCVHTADCLALVGLQNALLVLLRTVFPSFVSRSDMEAVVEPLVQRHEDGYLHMECVGSDTKVHLRPYEGDIERDVCATTFLTSGALVYPVFSLRGGRQNTTTGKIVPELVVSDVFVLLPPCDATTCSTDSWDPRVAASAAPPPPSDARRAEATSRPCGESR